MTNFLVLSRVASGEKAAPKVDTAAAASLDYTDIPNSQIRKVSHMSHMTSFVASIIS